MKRERAARVAEPAAQQQQQQSGQLGTADPDLPPGPPSGPSPDRIDAPMSPPPISTQQPQPPASAERQSGLQPDSQRAELPKSAPAHAAAACSHPKKPKLEGEPASAGSQPLAGAAKSGCSAMNAASAVKFKGSIMDSIPPCPTRPAPKATLKAEVVAKEEMASATAPDDDAADSAAGHICSWPWTGGRPILTILSLSSFGLIPTRLCRHSRFLMPLFHS